MAAAVDPAAALAALRAQANSLHAPLALPDECLKEWVLFAGTKVPTFVMARTARSWRTAPTRATSTGPR